MDVVKKHIEMLKQTQPEEYAKLMKSYRKEQDLIAEVRHYAAKANKMIKGAVIK